jgi:twitching motility protein PilU
MAIPDELKRLLRLLMEKEASDLYLATGAPPTLRVHGNLLPVGDQNCAPGHVRGIAYEVMNEAQRSDFERKPEMNLALSDPGVGRFRVNIFKQRHEISMVIRSIKTEIPKFDSLGLPPILTRIVMSKRGLVLFVGGTGSGKSTSLAALIDYRNTNSAGHIITIEDPVEFVHRHKRSIVNQREVGVDTDSYQDALENTLRQAPDVILIGEIRTRETMEHAIAFSETGHLCLSTLHANNANQALDRIINFFPEERHNQLLLDLSLNLVAIVSQRLIPSPKGGRVAAVELLLGTPRARDLVRKNEIHALKDLMERSQNQGMKTFDAALYELWKAGKISMEDALKNADSANNLRIRMQLGDSKPDDTHPPGTPAAAAAAARAAKGGPTLDSLQLEPIDTERNL